MGKWFRFRFLIALLGWLIIAASAISLIAVHPHIALTIAIVGGIALGVASVVGYKRS
jgi:hypothetical protein